MAAARRSDMNPTVFVYLVAVSLQTVAPAVPASPRAVQQAALSEMTPEPGGEPSPEPDEVDSAQEESPRWAVWEARLGLAASADSNPALLSEELSLNVASANQTLPGAVRDDAANLDVRLAAYPGLRTSGRSEHLGLTFEGRQSLYQQLDFLNLTELRGVAHLAWGRTPLGYLSGPLGWTRVPNGTSSVTVLLQGGTTLHLLDGDFYLRVLSGSGSVRWRETRSLATQADLEVRDLRFATEPAVGKLSGREARLGVSQILFLGREDRYLRIEALAGERHAGRPFTSSLRRAGAELSLPLADRWDLYLAGTHQEENFDFPESDLFAVFSPFDPEFDPSIRGNPRRDTVNRATAALTWSWKAIQVTARSTYIARDSSLGTQSVPDAYDYSRTIHSLGLTWSFGKGFS